MFLVVNSMFNLEFTSHDNNQRSEFLAHPPLPVQAVDKPLSGVYSWISPS